MTTTETTDQVTEIVEAEDMDTMEVVVATDIVTTDVKSVEEPDGVIRTN